MPNSKKGFTLIELLVAISIIAILSTVALVAFSQAQASARNSKRKQDLEEIKKALYLYKTATGSFCPANPANPCGWATYVSDPTYGFNCTACAANSLKNTLLPYFKVEPHDPTLGAGNIDYHLNINFETFSLSAKLESTANPIAIGGCAIWSGYNYCISE